MIKLNVTEENMKRYCILNKVIEGLITLKDASKLLGISYRQMIRPKNVSYQKGLKAYLAEIHNINLSYKTLRKILINAGLHEPRKKVYRRRRRREEAG